MAHLCLQVRIALHYPYARHVEVIVFLLERRRTESHAVACTESQVEQGFVAHIEFRRQARQVAVGEVVISQCAHHLPLVADEPVILCEGIKGVLLAGVVLQIGVVEIVVHEVRPDGQHAATLESVVIEHPEGVLHIAVVAYVESRDALIV